jgi:hypothetical protein
MLHPLPPCTWLLDQTASSCRGTLPCLFFFLERDERQLDFVDESPPEEEISELSSLSLEEGRVFGASRVI